VWPAPQLSSLCVMHEEHACVSLCRDEVCMSPRIDYRVPTHEEHVRKGMHAWGMVCMCIPYAPGEEQHKYCIDSFGNVELKM